MISITLGGGAEFYISNNDRMGVRKVVRGDVESDIDLGEATEGNMDRLLSLIGELSAHTIEGT